MKTLCAVLITLSPLASWAQSPSKSSCVTSIKVRSMSISTAEAEKLCEQDYEVSNCAVTAMQSSHSAMGDAVKKCRQEWGIPEEKVVEKTVEKKDEVKKTEPLDVTKAAKKVYDEDSEDSEPK